MCVREGDKERKRGTYRERERLTERDVDRE